VTVNDQVLIQASVSIVVLTYPNQPAPLAPRDLHGASPVLGTNTALHILA
jgi:hypothetical protein